MRTLRTLVMGMAMVGMVGATAVLHAQSSDFTLSADGDTLIRYNGPGGRVVIPDGVKVIGQFAFGVGSYLYPYENTTLTGVVIPEGVTTIGDYAFEYCKALTSATLPSTLKTIDIGAFDLSGLTGSLTIPDGVTTIRDFAFSECSSLTSVTIPNSVTSLGNGAFSHCTSLTEAIVGDNVPSMNGVFSACSALQNLAMGTGIKNLRAHPSVETPDPQHGMFRSPLETLVMRSLQPPTLTYKGDLPDALPPVRVLHIREGSRALWEADTNGWTTWATEIREDIFTVRDTVWKDTLTLHDTLRITQHDTIFADTVTVTLEVHDTLYKDTLTIHVTVPVHDTIWRRDTLYAFYYDTLTLTLHVHDTLWRTDTLWRDTLLVNVPGPEVHDTVYRDGTDTLWRTDTLFADTLYADTLIIVQRDTFIIVNTIERVVTVHDTVTVTDIIERIDTVAIYDTVWQDRYIVLNDVTGLEYVVAESEAYVVIEAGGGEDMLYFRGLVQNVEIAVYDLTGALIAKSTRMPIHVPAHGVLIVRQGGRYYKFVR